LSFWGFLIVYNKLKNDFTGRLELDLEVLIVNLGDSVRLLPLLLKSVTTFLIFWSSGIGAVFFTSAIQ